MKTINHLTCLLVVLFSLVWTTSAVAAWTYYYSFEGCFNRSTGNVPLSIGDCFEGRIGYEKQNGILAINVTEFWFEIDGKKIDIDYWVDDGFSSYSYNWVELFVELRGTAQFGDSELTRVVLHNRLGDVNDLELAFATIEDTVRGPITGGTFVHFPGPPPLEAMNVGLNDAWFDPATSGQGFFVTVFPVDNKAVAAWYTYDTELPADGVTANLGNAGHRWLTGIGSIVGNKATISIDLTSGGLFDTANEVQPVEWTSDYGTIILTFDNCEVGTVEYDIPSIGRTGIVPIQRVSYDNVGLCQKLDIE